MKHVIRVATFAASAMLANPAVAAPLIGDKITCTGMGYRCFTPSAAVGSGVEFVAGFPEAAIDRERFSVDFATSSLTITWLYAISSFGIFTTSFVNETNRFGAITSFEKSGQSTVTAANFSVQNGVLTFSHSDQTSGNGATFKIGFAAGAVPEPTTWAMMLIGFGMVAGAARCRRRAAKVAYA